MSAVRTETRARRGHRSRLSSPGTAEAQPRRGEAICGPLRRDNPRRGAASVFPSGGRPVLLALLLTGLLLAACGTDAPATPVPTQPPAAISYPHTVQYEITGAARETDAIYVWYGPTAGDTKLAKVRLPWRRSFGAREGEYVYVSAQNRAGAGPITCRILLDGATLRRDTAPAQGSVASCDATLGKE